MSLTGETREDQFFMEINWTGGSVGEYHGTFRGRHLAGNTFDRSHPESQASWFVNGKVFELMR
jgi:hypothetical protein